MHMALHQKYLEVCYISGCVMWVGFNLRNFLESFWCIGMDDIYLYVSNPPENTISLANFLQKTHLLIEDTRQNLGHPD